MKLLSELESYINGLEQRLFAQAASYDRLVKEFYHLRKLYETDEAAFKDRLAELTRHGSNNAIEPIKEK